MAKDISDVLAENADNIESIVSQFQEALEKMVEAAQTAVADQLRKNLSITGGRVESSGANQRVLSNVDDLFSKELDRLGYQQLVQNYTDSFSGQMVSFQRVMEHLNENLLYPLPEVRFTPADLAEFDVYKMNARQMLTDVVQKVGLAAKQQALLNVGGLPVKELKQAISQQFGKTVGEARTLADTSLTNFYRTVTDQGFQIIEQDLPGFKIRYNYEGPLDKITRPFCRKLERQSRNGKSWTRKEIEKLSNGQITNVFISCGGYNCRHQWVISIRELREQQAKRKPPTVATQRDARSEAKREVVARRALHTDRIRRQVGAGLPLEQVQAIRESVVAKVKSLRNVR